MPTPLRPNPLIWTQRGNFIYYLPGHPLSLSPPFLPSPPFSHSKRLAEKGDLSSAVAGAGRKRQDVADFFVLAFNRTGPTGTWFYDACRWGVDILSRQIWIPGSLANMRCRRWDFCSSLELNRANRPPPECGGSLSLIRPTPSVLDTRANGDGPFLRLNDFWKSFNLCLSLGWSLGLEVVQFAMGNYKRAVNSSETWREVLPSNVLSVLPNLQSK